jgi:hypothetical protein
MKKLLFSVITVFLLSFNNYSQESNKTFYPFYMDWDGWGRTSKECHGFGLCHFSSCTFCCVQEGVIVPCNDKVKLTNTGIVLIDPDTNRGFLTITLDPSDPQQKDAIKNKEIFYIDDDLKNDDLKGDRIMLLKGEYVFDSAIGKYGGYKVNAVLLK